MAHRLGVTMGKGKGLGGVFRLGTPCFLIGGRSFLLGSKSTNTVSFGEQNYQFVLSFQHLTPSLGNTRAVPCESPPSIPPHPISSLVPMLGWCWPFHCPSLSHPWSHTPYHTHLSQHLSITDTWIPFTSRWCCKRRGPHW